MGGVKLTLGGCGFCMVSIDFRTAVDFRVVWHWGWCGEITGYDL